MKISEQLATMRGGGHNIPHGLDEILEDLDKRVSALEGGKKEEPKPSAHATGAMAGNTVFAPADHNPLDGTNLKS